MGIAYFPGCTLSTNAKGYDLSGRAVASALGIPLETLPDWQCCGATFPLATDNSMAFIAPTYILSQAQKAGGQLTTLCAICFHVLRRTQQFLVKQPEMLERINWFTEDPYHGNVKVSHFLEILRDQVTWQMVGEKVKQPLQGLRVAPYYGCLLLRPQNEIGLDDSDHPRILHDCVTVLGGKAVDFPYQDECCGSYLLVSRPELPQKLAENILLSAEKNGAQAIITACPLCQFNLDYPQRPGSGINLIKGNIPVLYFTQLMAVALDLPPENWGMEHHYVDPHPLFKPIAAARASGQKG
jgi:heterodisulfide reductase subunit B